MLRSKEYAEMKCMGKNVGMNCVENLEMAYEKNVAHVFFVYSLDADASYIIVMVSCHCVKRCKFSLISTDCRAVHIEIRSMRLVLDRRRNHKAHRVVAFVGRLALGIVNSWHLPSLCRS